MAEEMFDGFDHTKYQEEVQQRWGKDAYATSDTWWRGMGAEEKAAWTEQSRKLGADWTAAAQSGVLADSAEAQDLARRHVEWLRGIPGTPAASPAAGGPAGGNNGAGPDIRGSLRDSARCMWPTPGSPRTTAVLTERPLSGTP